MRYILFSGLALGMILGVLAPVAPTYGTTCTSGSQDMTNQHVSGETCCACGQEDHAVDKLKATSGSGVACLVAIEITNVEEFSFPLQCDTVGTTFVQFTVLVERTNPLNISQFDTDVSVGGTICNDDSPDSRHAHGSAFFCNCPGC